MNNIVDGLHAVADFIDDHSWVLDARPIPAVPLQIRYSVTTSLTVIDIADSAGVPAVSETWDDGAAHTRAVVRFGNVELVVYHIGKRMLAGVEG